MVKLDWLYLHLVALPTNPGAEPPVPDKLF